MIEKFFDESKEQSQIKAEIVKHYFKAWAQIIAGTQRRFPNRSQKIGYVDLFAGPGRYKDGATSTPVQVIESALESEDLSQRLVTIFNDKDPGNADSLKSELDSIHGIEKLSSPPEIWNEEVGDKIAAQFENIIKIPILAFIDPWGYV